MLDAGGDRGESNPCILLWQLILRYKIDICWGFLVIKEQNTKVQKEIPLHWLFMEVKM